MCCVVETTDLAADLVINLTTHRARDVRVSLICVSALVHAAGFGATVLRHCDFRVRFQRACFENLKHEPSYRGVTGSERAQASAEASVAATEAVSVGVSIFFFVLF